MTKSHSTRIANYAAKRFEADPTSSLGFWRLNHIPTNPRCRFTLAFAAKNNLCVLKNGQEVQNLIVAKLNAMTIDDFKIFLLGLKKLGE